MTDFAGIEQRLATLQARVASGRVDETLLEEVEAVLADGYLSALRAEARRRRVLVRLHRLADDRPYAAHEARRLAREKQAIDESTGELRARLRQLRSLAARYAAARRDSA